MSSDPAAGLSDEATAIQEAIDALGFEIQHMHSIEMARLVRRRDGFIAADALTRHGTVSIVSLRYFFERAIYYADHDRQRR